ncbi:F0F1 ATP synthase subunit gamma [Zhongshania borealis]|uniref:F0F1 ATP synthase subunit gamma n=2 Tax=Zhongshania borealis TaxID=889488 RepID=A0ABP7W698_9GAMM
MKAVAASSIGDYERAVAALADYYQTVERGLSVSFRQAGLYPVKRSSSTTQQAPCIILFGTDQGLVGQFNDRIAEFAKTSLTSTVSIANSRPAKPPLIWVVGERLNERLTDAGIRSQAHFDVPNSVKSITPLIGEILLNIETQQPLSAQSDVKLFYNRPTGGSVYAPVTQRLLPLNQQWCEELANRAWPTTNVPELLGDNTRTLGAFIREYLFVSLFRASAESLSSENASRLAAMQRADKNIGELLTELQRNYHRLRQAGIDAEMFDVIAGSGV